jgi:hypothetical protein
LFYYFCSDKIATMKTKPYGVRFEIELLDLMKERLNIKTPQRVLNYLSDKWILENIQGVTDIKLLMPKNGICEDENGIQVQSKISNIESVEIATKKQVKNLQEIQIEDDVQESIAYNTEPFFTEDEVIEDVKVYEAHDDEYYYEERINCVDLDDTKTLWNKICNDTKMNTLRRNAWEVELQIKKLKI